MDQQDPCSDVEPYANEGAIASFPLPPSPRELEDLWATIPVVDQVRLIFLSFRHSRDREDLGRSDPEYGGYDFIGRAWKSALETSVAVPIAISDTTKKLATVSTDDRVRITSVPRAPDDVPILDHIRHSRHGLMKARDREIDPEKDMGRRFFSPARVADFMEFGLRRLLDRRRYVGSEVRRIPLVGAIDTARNVPTGLVWLTRGLSDEDMRSWHRIDHVMAEAGIFTYRFVNHEATRGLGPLEGLKVYESRKRRQAPGQTMPPTPQRDEDRLRYLKAMALRNRVRD